MEWEEIVKQIVTWLIPIALAWIFGKLGIDVLKAQKYNKYVKYVDKMVLAAAAIFMDGEGKAKFEYVYGKIRQWLIDNKMYVPDTEVQDDIHASYKATKLSLGVESLSK